MTLSRSMLILMVGCIAIALLALPSLMAPASSKLAQDAQNFAMSQQFHAQAANLPGLTAQASNIARSLMNIWATYPGGPIKNNPDKIRCALLKAGEKVNQVMVWFEDKVYGAAAAWYDAQSGGWLGAQNMFEKSFPKPGFVEVDCNSNFPRGPLAVQ